ncbi:MAG: branched-chain amino acid ABC transporter permease [Chloroflexi bacterium]|nr:branched-chain amino acid ABC transporter permease [Chloroflexota bacterium]
MIGIANGAVIALIALGYTLVYGIIELINFAHGDLFMLGSFVALTVVGALGFTAFGATTATPAWLAILIALIAAAVFCGILNVIIERVAYRRLRHAPRLAPLISAIGVSFILLTAGLYWKGPSPQNFPNLIPDFDILRDVFGIRTIVQFNLKEIFVVATAIPLMIVVTLFIRRTKMGKAMRAVAQDREMAGMVGIDVDRVISFTFLLGGLLAGAAGLIYGLFNENTSFNLGFSAGLKAFTAAVLGGIGNVAGAMLGGFLLGILGSLTVFYIDARWEQVVVFSVLVLILVFRPRGLLGEEV